MIQNFFLSVILFSPVLTDRSEPASLLRLTCQFYLLTKPSMLPCRLPRPTFEKCRSHTLSLAREARGSLVGTRLISLPPYFPKLSIWSTVSLAGAYTVPLGLVEGPRPVSLRPWGETLRPNEWAILFSLTIATMLPASFEVFLHQRCRFSELCQSESRVFLL